MSKIKNYKSNLKNFLYLYSTVTSAIKGNELKNKMAEDYTAMWKIIPILLDERDIPDAVIKSMVQLVGVKYSKDYDQLYISRLRELNLLDYIPDEPKRILDSRFYIIWDTVHLLALEVDQYYITYENMTEEERGDFKTFINLVKVIFINLWTLLLCPTCIEHYKILRGSIIEPIEGLQVAMYRSDRGYPIPRETQPYILSKAAFGLHNSVNNYRMIQRNDKTLYRPMSWETFCDFIKE